LGLTRSESGRLGAIQSRITAQKQKEQRIYTYLENPTICKTCGSSLPYEKRHNIFCNRSCSASFNNLGIQHNKPRRELRDKCINCGGRLKENRNKFCSINCHKDFMFKEYCVLVENLQEFPNMKEESQTKRPKRYLIYKNGNRCSICNNIEWQGRPIPLVFDHIDGNSSNWRLNNCRLVCGNCDMQLPTYKSKNKNSGRHYRRQRRLEGKSF